MCWQTHGCRQFEGALWFKCSRCVISYVHFSSYCLCLRARRGNFGEVGKVWGCPSHLDHGVWMFVCLFINIWNSFTSFKSSLEFFTNLLLVTESLFVTVYWMSTGGVLSLMVPVTLVYCIHFVTKYIYYTINNRL